MIKTKHILFCFLYVFAIILAVLYFLYLFVLPTVVNRIALSGEFSDFIKSKLNYDLVLEGFQIKTTPCLNTIIDVNKIILKSGNEKVIDADKLDLVYDIKHFKTIEYIKAQEVFINRDLINTNFKNKKTKKKISFEYKNIPKIDISRIVYKSTDFNVEAKEVLVNENIGRMKAEITSPYLKHKFLAGNKGQIIFKKNQICADNLEMELGHSVLIVEGVIYDKNGYDLRLRGNCLPIDDIEKTLLYYQKSQDPAKKFIENFKDYNGSADIDIMINKDGIYGKCSINDLSVRTVLFNIPLFFKKADFIFDGKTVISDAKGKLGNEDVQHSLEIVNLGSQEKEVTGFFTANLTEKFNYIPHLSFDNTVTVKLIYNIKRKKIEIQYLVDLPENSDLIYKTASLGLKDKNRRFYVKTTKADDTLKIDEYSYYTQIKSEKNEILLGEGVLKKINGKMIPQYITCKTKGSAPVSFISSIVRYVSGGTFNGNLRYDFNKEKIFGNFEIANAKVKEFFVKSAKVIGEESGLKIEAGGKYHNEPFSCKITAKNGFSNGIIINNMDLFLNKFIVKRNSKPALKQKVNISQKVQNSDLTIENWKIKVNSVKKDRIRVDNIVLYGSLKNDIFAFSMPELSYADGILSAEGKYNFGNDSSDIFFRAKNINSEIISDTVFNLPREVVATADATLRMKTKNKLEDIKCGTEFRVKNGFLPKLGSMSFMTKNLRRINISDLVNIDFTRRDALQSDIQGSFNIDNSLIKDISITSKQQYLSMLVEGDYEINKQYANLNLYGKYNKEAPKGVKILFVPLNLVLKTVFRPEDTKQLYKSKLDKIPSIDADNSKSQFFRVKLEGDLNNEKLKVEIKSIK